MSAECPVCGRRVPGDGAGHVERCLRRPRVRAYAELEEGEEGEEDGSYGEDSKLDAYEEADEEEVEDEEAEEEEVEGGGVLGSSSSKRSRVGASAKSKKKAKVRFSGALVDDWEDSSFLRRTAGTSPEPLATAYGASVSREAHDRLFEYQREGLRWLFLLYKRDGGGILGDEMGLGKTVQLCCHLESIALSAGDLSPRAQSASLVVCPATLLHHWLREMHTWAPSLRVVIMHAMSPTFLELSQLGDGAMRGLRKLLRSPDPLVVLTSYDGVRANMQALLSVEWTAICLDEGQKIRNPEADVSAACKQLRGRHRLILSGTPIQNSLKELWSLFDFVCPGKLGSLEVFEVEISKPIREGAYKSASKFQSELGVRSAIALQSIIMPHLLRRKKEDLKEVTSLTAKSEKVLFCRLTPRQREMYLEVVNSKLVRKILKRELSNAFAALTMLRKICNHPDLASADGKLRWADVKRELDAAAAEGEEEEGEGVYDGSSGGATWDDSGKLVILSKLLSTWKRDGDKVLVFSQSRGMLDMVECLLRTSGYSFLRLDGSTPVSRRSHIISAFNDDADTFVMLLTTKTGGVGISLTSANRVVLIDPCWNPQTDCQARERSWRIGQKRDVSIYRLITKGTIEEKMYERQIFKLLLSNRILQNAKQKGLFTPNTLKDLFALKDFDDGELPSAGALSCRDVATSSASSEDAVNSKDNKILQALFDGTSICAVYDHNFLESQFMSSMLAEATTKTANDIVEKAKRRLQTSGARGAMSHQQSSSIQFDILQRIKAIFGDSSSLSSQQIIREFGDVSAEEAPIFREMLRRVATLRNGKWIQLSQT